MKITPQKERVRGSTRILHIRLALSLLLCVCSSLPAEKKRDDPGIPGAELLVRSFSEDTFELVLSGESTSVLQSLPLEEYRFSKGIPSISADGNMVASTYRISNEKFRYPILIASTYSVENHEWTEHSECEGDLVSTATSPDGSQLACITRYMQPGSELGNSPPELKILNLQTGKLRVIRTSEWPGLHMSWSPDGRRLAFDGKAPGAGYGTLAIYILNVETGEISQIALGESPAWSPSGEWIAFASYAELKGAESESGNSSFYQGHYYSLSRHQFSIMSPVGTHTRLLMKFNSDVEDHTVPVWSPDSRTVLLTRVRDPDYGTADIYEFDLVHSKRAKKFANITSEIYCWINAPGAD